MNKTQKTKKITEGETGFFVFKNKDNVKGPGSKNNQPFYNPAMELNRDLSILVCQWLINNNSKRVHILDGLAASGARGVRIKNEVKGDFDLSINDWNEDAYNLIEENIKNCKIKDVSLFDKDLNVLLSEKKFNYIDIDPFGSPVYFIDAAMRSIKNNGVLACTATDTATLCGVYPKVCNRRYNAMPFHSFFMKEIGLRILIGYICREAAKYEKGIKPLICHSDDHYFRVYIMVKNGVNFANQSLSNFAFMKSDSFVFMKKPVVNIGPLWTGKIQDKKMVREIRNILFEKKLNNKNNLWKLLDLLEGEADSPCFYYTTDDVASLLKKSPPRIDGVIENLKKDNYIVTRTHFSPTGFKTNAPWGKIEKVFRNNSL